MQRLAAAQVGDLVAAGGAVGDDEGVGRGGAHGGSRLSSAMAFEASSVSAA